MTEFSIIINFNRCNACFQESRLPQHNNVLPSTKQYNTVLPSSRQYNTVVSTYFYYLLLLLLQYYLVTHHLKRLYKNNYVLQFTVRSRFFFIIRIVWEKRRKRSRGNNKVQQALYCNVYIVYSLYMYKLYSSYCRLL